MGIIHTEITLINNSDTILAARGYMREDEVRSITVTALVDTGAATLVINEEQCQALGLGIIEEREARVADGRKVFCKVTDAVEIRWKNRSVLCSAMVVPRTETVLLGAIPLEFMDLIISPAKQELVGAHGDEAPLLLL